MFFMQRTRALINHTKKNIGIMIHSHKQGGA